jgi:hypothetical protein
MTVERPRRGVRLAVLGLTAGVIAAAVIILAGLAPGERFSLAVSATCVEQSALSPEAC